MMKKPHEIQLERRIEHEKQKKKTRICQTTSVCNWIGILFMHYTHLINVASKFEQHKITTRLHFAVFLSIDPNRNAQKITEP